MRDDYMLTEPEVTTCVRYVEHGQVSAGARPVSGRDPQEAARKAPPHALAFFFFDRAQAVAVVGGTGVTLSCDLRYSGRYYIDGRVMDLDEAEKLPGDHSAALRELRRNESPRAVLCRTGVLQDFEDGDQVVSTRDGA